MDTPLTDASTAINMGTLYYELRDWPHAAECYAIATRAEPSNPIAFYNLGNALDEMGRREEAVTAFERAVQIHPTHADAHYNLAICLQKQGKNRAALKHYRIYVRLDSSPPWCDHARAQIRKLLASDPLCIVVRNGQPIRKMKLVSSVPIPHDASTQLSLFKKL